MACGTVCCSVRLLAAFMHVLTRAICMHVCGLCCFTAALRRFLLIRGLLDVAVASLSPFAPVFSLAACRRRMRAQHPSRIAVCRACVPVLPVGPRSFVCTRRECVSQRVTPAAHPASPPPLPCAQYTDSACLRILKEAMRGGRESQSATLLDGVFRRMLDPAEFQRLVFPGLSADQRAACPRSLQEVISDSKYAEAVASLVPSASERARKVRVRAWVSPARWSAEGVKSRSLSPLPRRTHPHTHLP